ncbi:3577_t:CDS:1, partial [Cetraspora pellucida]
IKNTSNYSHLIDESDMQKQSKLIKDLISNKAIKYYNSSAIINV